ncbi:hypothetical protein O971_05870 [Mycobacterium avium subsp. hominissuis 10-4249]|nr:hypothetical protein O971_05870 [Mycobacterium avium subsp. hominissuis 10-4249]KDO94868.1 hypothetical protein MAVA5_15355 [Mycobacterium avium subsp. hominissuis A5]
MCATISVRCVSRYLLFTEEFAESAQVWPGEGLVY